MITRVQFVTQRPWSKRLIRRCRNRLLDLLAEEIAARHAVDEECVVLLEMQVVLPAYSRRRLATISVRALVDDGFAQRREIQLSRPTRRWRH